MPMRRLDIARDLRTDDHDGAGAWICQTPRARVQVPEEAGERDAGARLRSNRIRCLAGEDISRPTNSAAMEFHEVTQTASAGDGLSNHPGQTKN